MKPETIESIVGAIVLAGYFLVVIVMPVALCVLAIMALIKYLGE